jgi:membrane protease subunit HflK
MPWNDQSGGSNGGKEGGGPWGSGPRPPWGQTPRPPASAQPDLEEMLRRLNARWRNPFGGRGGGRGEGGGRNPFGFAFVGALLAAGWVASGIYTVDQGEQAVVMRFGKYEGPPKEAGLHWHVPFPVETARVEPVSRQRQTLVGRDAEGHDVENESLMLTGDKNIVDINFTVVWQLNSIEKYAFNVRDPQESVKAVAESAMREIVGKRQLDDIITKDRSRVEQETQERLQQILDFYETGVMVAQVQLNRAAPPSQVVDAFQDVIKAGQDQVTKRNEAELYRNDVVPKARGNAAAAVQDAEAYREQVVREAEGEAQRFSAVLTEYHKAPAVTRQRLYLEAMERIYGGADKIIVDARGSGVQPYLPLDQLRKQPAGPAPAAGQ